MFSVSLIMCIILKFGRIIQLTDFSILLLFFFCFTCVTISKCFLISVFFSKANIAAVLSGVIFFLLYLPYVIYSDNSKSFSPSGRFAMLLLSITAFGAGTDVLDYYERQKVGVQWSNFYNEPPNSFSLNTICLILVFDSILYMILAFYLECVIPGEYGRSKPWYFPIYYVIPKGFFKKKAEEKEISEYEMNEENDLIEPESSLKPGIEINDLHKLYRRGNRHALKGLTVKFYENEISSFLGHNGAGKSTTMHLLTGLFKPTRGTAKVNGLDINESMDEIRKSLGFVPQHNILFPLLSVKEHLLFFSRLKGGDFFVSLDEINKMLEDTNLIEKTNELSKNLSGGMKRKLSSNFFYYY